GDDRRRAGAGGHADRVSDRRDPDRDRRGAADRGGGGHRANARRGDPDRGLSAGDGRGDGVPRPAGAAARAHGGAAGGGVELGGTDRGRWRGAVPAAWGGGSARGSAGGDRSD